MEKPHNEIERLATVVFGNKPGHEDGLVGIVTNMTRTLYGTEQQPGGLVEDMQAVTEKAAAHEITLYGTRENPGGIAQDIRKLQKTFMIGSTLVGACGVAVVVIEVLNKLVPVFQHLK